MSNIEVEKPRLSACPEQDEVTYQALSGLALAALGFGLASAVAILALSLWFIPLAGVILSAVALWRIQQQAPMLLGRKAALIGLALSLFFAVAVPVDWAVYRWQLRREARQFAGEWFEFLKKGEILKAHQLTNDASRRLPLDASLPTAYIEGTEPHKSLTSYVERGLVRTLLELGEKAEVRYYDTERQFNDGEADTVQQTYAVTFDPPEGRTTFFAKLTLQRSVPHAGHQSYWRVLNAEGGVRPAALGGTEGKQAGA